MSKSKNQDYPVIHHVFFWLQNPDSVTDREQLIAGIKTLAAIETVHNLHVGVVADTEKRDVVESGWDVSELMFFSDTAAQEIYQNHSIHHDFIKAYSHLWKKVVVYDMVAV